MKTTFTYRIANLSDFDQLQELGKESYAQFSKVLTKENWNRMNSFLKSDENLIDLIEKSTVYVCEKESNIVGMIYLVPSGNPTELFDANWSYIRFLGVHTKFRGNGIGKRLTELCIEHATKTNERCIGLHTSEFMDPARVIYEQKGFKKMNEIQYLGKRYWVYLLNLEGSNTLSS